MMSGSAPPQSGQVLDSLKNYSSFSPWWGPHLRDEMLRDWEMTRTIRDAQRVVVEKVSEPGHYIGFRPLHRHQKRYKNKQRNRITRLRDYQRLARYVIHMTVDPKLYASDHEAKDALLRAWYKMYHRLRRRSDNVQGLRAVEAQQNGQPHIHVVLWGVYLPKDWGPRMWKLYGGYVKVERVRHGNAAVVSYLGKYLSKMSDLDLAALTRWGAQTLTVCGKEMRELLGPLNSEKTSEDWELFGFYHCREEIVWSLGEDFAEELYNDPTGPPN